jgi:hypothetical protein
VVGKFFYYLDIPEPVKHNARMPKRSSKQRLPDPIEVAFGVIQRLGGEEPAAPVEPPADGKNPAAVALGRLGGLKGGAARAKSLSKKQRSDIAKKAAKARALPVYGLPQDIF